MHKMIFFLSAAALVLGICGGVGATLHDQGDGTIYDDVSKLYWYADLSYFTGKTYEQQLDMIDDLGWGHLATADEMEGLWSTNSASEIGSAFTSSGEHTTAGGTHYFYWFGRYESKQDADPNHYYAQVWHDTTHDIWDRNPLGTNEIPDNEQAVWGGAWVASPFPKIEVPFGYSVKSDVDDVLYRIDLGTGAETPIGTGVGFGAVEGLAFDPITGNLFGVDGEIDQQLITIDTTTGEGTAIGPLGLHLNNPGMAIDAAGNIYISSYQPGEYNLFSADRNTGAATLIGASWVTALNGLAFMDGILYAVSGDHDALFTIDINSSAATWVGNLGIDLVRNGLGLAADGTYLWAIDDGGTIAYIDPATGAATQTATTGVGFDGLAVRSDIIPFCECDLEPAAGDKDVDGADLAAYIANNAGISLAVFAGEFGRTDCP